MRRTAHGQLGPGAGRVVPGQCAPQVQTLCLGKRIQNPACSLAPGNTSPVRGMVPVRGRLVKIVPSAPPARARWRQIRRSGAALGVVLKNCLCRFLVQGLRSAPPRSPPHPTPPLDPPLSLPTAPPPHPPAVQRSVRLEQPRQRAQPRLHGCCPGTRSHSSPPAPASDARDGSLMGRWRRAAAAAVGAADTPPPPPSVAPAAVTKGRATGRACAGGWFVMHTNLLDHFSPCSATPGPSANHPCQGQHNFDESTLYR